MAEVHFSEDVGGSGLRVTDDANPDTGLKNYGWTLRFVPALEQLIAIAKWVKSFVLGKQAEINSTAEKVATAAATITTATDTATQAAASATQAATDAADHRNAAAVSAAEAAAAAAEAIAIAAGGIINDQTPSPNQVFSSEYVASLFKAFEETVKTIVEESKTGGVYSGTILFPEELELGNFGATATVDWSKAHSQRATLTANVQLTFTPPAGVFRGSLKLINGAATARAITWPSGIKYLGGVAPQVPDAKAGAVGIYAVYWDGATWWVSGGRYS